MYRYSTCIKGMGNLCVLRTHTSTTRNAPRAASRHLYSAVAVSAARLSMYINRLWIYIYITKKHQSALLKECGVRRRGGFVCTVILI